MHSRRTGPQQPVGQPAARLGTATVLAVTTVPLEVLRLLQCQGGMARRQDLRAAGLSRRGLCRLLADGELRPLAGDVVTVWREPSTDEATRAAVIGVRGTASHTSAAVAWGIELVQRGPVEVTVPRDRSRAAWPAAVVHRRDLPPHDVVMVDGLRLTTPLRTVLDLARSLPLEGAVAAADSALRQGLVTLDELLATGSALPAARGRARVCRVGSLVDPSSGSVLESVCRVLFALAGLPTALTQYAVRGPDGRLLGRVDFAWPEHRLVVETDGYAFHADRRSYRDDRRRTNALVVAGWRVVRFTWEDVMHDPAHVVAVVRKALALA